MTNHAGEEVAAYYRTGNTWHPQVMDQLQHLLRDLRENQRGPLPALLIEMVSILQDRFGFARPLNVNSGFRTRKTNNSLEGAAPDSFHLDGMAIDLSMRGLAATDLASEVFKMSQTLGFAGVGFYDTFVHMDIGPQRAWTRLSR